MFGLGFGELLVILVLALIFIGPKKIPELARSLGKGIREFQKAKDDLMHEINHPLDDHTEDNTRSVTEQQSEQIESLEKVSGAPQQNSEEEVKTES